MSSLECGKIVSGAGMPFAFAPRNICHLFVSDRTWAGETLGKVNPSPNTPPCSATNTAVLSVVGRRMGREPTRRPTSNKKRSDRSTGTDRSHVKVSFQYREDAMGNVPLSLTRYTGMPSRPRVRATPSAP